MKGDTYEDITTYFTATDTKHQVKYQSTSQHHLPKTAGDWNGDKTKLEQCKFDNCKNQVLVEICKRTNYIKKNLTQESYQQI